MASIISAGTTSGTALNMTADTTGALQLATNSGTTAVTIDTSQNVGIGTTSPASTLEVAGLATFQKGGNSGITIGNVSTNSGSVIRMQGTSAGYNWQFDNNVNATGLSFTPSTAAGGTTYTTPTMVLTGAGAVGIGTSSPAAPLQVSYTTESGFRLSNTSATPSDWTMQTLNSGILRFYSYTAGAERMRFDAAGNVLIPSNTLYGYQAAPTSKAAATTLTGAELIVGILNTTGTTYTITLPTGTNIDAAVSTSLAANGFFDWWVINTASGTITIGANGNTTMGTLTVATGVSAQFRFRKTAANTYTVYRLG